MRVYPCLLKNENILLLSLLFVVPACLAPQNLCWKTHSIKIYGILRAVNNLDALLRAKCSDPSMSICIIALVMFLSTANGKISSMRMLQANGQGL